MTYALPPYACFASSIPPQRCFCNSFIFKFEVPCRTEDPHLLTGGKSFARRIILGRLGRWERLADSSGVWERNGRRWVRSLRDFTQLVRIFTRRRNRLAFRRPGPGLLSPSLPRKFAHYRFGRSLA